MCIFFLHLQSMVSFWLKQKIDNFESWTYYRWHFWFKTRYYWYVLGLFRFVTDYHHEKTNTEIYNENFTESVPVCRALHTIEKFSTIANYAWIFIEALYLHTLISNPFVQMSSYFVTRYAFIGWLIPILPTIGWCIQYYKNVNNGNN